MDVRVWETSKSEKDTSLHLSRLALSPHLTSSSRGAVVGGLMCASSRPRSISVTSITGIL